MKFLLATAATALLLTPGPSFAATSAQNTQRVQIANFGRCLAERDRAKAAALLSGTLDDDAERAARVNLDYKVCKEYFSTYQGTLRASQMLIDGAMAEALLGKTLPALDASAVAAIAPLTYPEIHDVNPIDKKTGKALSADALAKKEEGRVNFANFVALRRLGECVVRTDLAGSVALLATAIASDEERAALKAVAPALPACISAGQTIKLDYASIRASTAIAYYRLAMAPTAKAAD
ncbi:hypothetical protein FSZ31_09860 [Sphingorhabdus soli]|uniref:Uncharacterized protein n=1 Tax=Flavisphingopyxis soli TaxID=2601267 RepID=A0A5C6U8M3_9SPHN|nr:hypothetical protein [Sphingorhabdus soli]TXC69212.1 hypothetical protein FSZ31_09860 [Sphingorhabdus soli]